MPDIFDAFAVTAPGLAPIVASELTALEVTPTQVVDAGVSFAATPEQLARANLWLRTASRVLVRLASFEATDFATLERKAKTVPWSRAIKPGAVAQLRVTCKKSRLYHSDAVAERVARGIESRIPGVRVALKATDEEREDNSGVELIIVRFDHDVCTISADSSGALLHRRGWRQDIAKAPLRETLASALIAVSKWDAMTPCVDPFCGSGTIGIEAALRARNMAAGMGRTFAMENWPGVSPALFIALRRDAHRAATLKVNVPIVVADRDAGACKAAVANAERAGVANDVTVIQRSVSDSNLATLGISGHVITNPPYGVRVSDGRDLRALYQRFGDVVRAAGGDWNVTMLAAEKSLVAETKLGLTTKIKTTNGGLPVTIESN